MKAEYSTDVLVLLKKKPPFLIRYGYVFLILFIFSFYIIGNIVKVPCLFYLSYIEADSRTSTFILKDSNNDFSKVEGLKDLYMIIGDITVKVEQISKVKDKVLISISHKDYSALQLNAFNAEFHMLYFVSLTTYMYDFLFKF